MHPKVPKLFNLLALVTLEEDVGLDLLIGFEDLLPPTFLAFLMTLYHKNTKNKYEWKHQNKLVTNKHIQRQKHYF